VSNARVAAAAETFVRRKIDDLLASLPHPSDHTPPRVPHPPSTKRQGRSQRSVTGWVRRKDRKSSDDKEQERKGEGSEENEEDAIHVKSSFALRPRDSLILSRDRISREHVSTSSVLQRV